MIYKNSKVSLAPGSSERPGTSRLEAALETIWFYQDERTDLSTEQRRELNSSVAELRKMIRLWTVKDVDHDDALLPEVAGDRLESTLEEFDQACRSCIWDEQRAIEPNTAYISVFCQGVRLAREMHALGRPTPRQAMGGVFDVGKKAFQDAFDELDQRGNTVTLHMPEANITEVSLKALADEPLPTTSEGDSINVVFTKDPRSGPKPGSLAVALQSMEWLRTADLSENVSMHVRKVDDYLCNCASMVILDGVADANMEAARKVATFWSKSRENCWDYPTYVLSRCFLGLYDANRYSLQVIQEMRAAEPLLSGSAKERTTAALFVLAERMQDEQSFQFANDKRKPLILALSQLWDHFSTQKDNHTELWQGYDRMIPSRALVTVSHGKAVVMEMSGGHIQHMMRQMFHDDLGKLLENFEPSQLWTSFPDGTGVFVWEGVYSPMAFNGYPGLVGNWRSLLPEEWKKFSYGELLWTDGIRPGRNEKDGR
jgi:hypothetical protein